MDYKAFSAFLDQDASYQATLKNHQELWAEVRSAETDVRMALRRVTRLMLAVDVLRQHQFKFEGLSEDQTKTLEEFTTDCDETWYSQYDQAGDDIEETAVAACAMVVEKRETTDGGHFEMRRLDWEKAKKAREDYNRSVDNTLDSDQRKKWRGGGYDHAFGKPGMGASNGISISTGTISIGGRVKKQGEHGEEQE